MTSTRTSAMVAGYEPARKRQTAAVWLLAILLTGCTSPANQPLYTRAGDWNWQSLHGQTIQTEHYLIRTTVTDDRSLKRMSLTLETAYRQYQALAPKVPESDRRLRVYLFAGHDEWADYTRATTGNDAAAYLAVFTGGYTIRDEFVCWLGNEIDTLSVAAHEGFHQFVGRHFRSRLPPTLEEGLATTYENLSVNGEQVSIQTQAHPRRQAALRRAIDRGYLIPLDTLIQMHAGDLSDRSAELVETYYAQAWALARMLRDEPNYRLPFLQMISDLAAGNQALDIGPGDGSQLYYPSRVKPVLQRYVAPDWDAFIVAYDAYMKRSATPANQGE